MPNPLALALILPTVAPAVKPVEILPTPSFLAAPAISLSAPLSLAALTPVLQAAAKPVADPKTRIAAVAAGVDASLKVLAKTDAPAETVQGSGEELVRVLQGGALGGSEAVVGRDRTAEYERLWTKSGGSSLRAGTVPLQTLRDYKVLLVPGFLSGALIQLGASPWGRHLGRSRYFGEAMDWLKRIGVEHELVDVHTVRDFKHNAAVIARAVETSEKPVLIISHSKGGRDTLEMLISNPQLRGKVKGWMPVQAPFLGAPGADWALAARTLNAAHRFVLEAFGGSRETVAEMTGESSRRYVAENAKAIAEVLEAVPTIAFASWKDFRLPGWMLFVNPVLKLTVDAISAASRRTDGLVPAESAYLPGMDRVVVSEMDHFVPFAKTHRDFDRIRFVRTMLTMLLGRQ